MGQAKATARIVLGTIGLVLGLGLLTVAPASAEVRIGPREVVVGTPGARAVIARSPFRLRVQDAAGRTVLSELGNAGRARPLVVEAQVNTGAFDQPDPAGLRRPTLYAPLSFTVGTQSLQAANPAGTGWIGNLLYAGRSGVQYSARRVLAARRVGRGVQLEVATSDPAGRRLRVRVAPARGAAIRVSARLSDPTGVVGLADAFTAGRDEAFRGFGGRHNALDQRGQAFYSWAEEENFATAAIKGTGGPPPQSSPSTDLFPNGPQAAYYPQALFYSSRPYGFLLDRSELARFRLASDRPDAWLVDASAPALDYVVAPGPARRAIGTLTAINGRHRPPPAWALDAQTSRLVTPRQSPAAHEAQIREDLRTIDVHRLRFGAYDMFGWPHLPRATARELIDAFHRRGIRVLLYFRAFVSEDATGYDDPGVFDTAVREGYVTRTRTGAPYLTASPNPGGAPAVLVDFTNPRAVRWWRGRVREALDLGGDGFMEDFGEQVFPDMAFADGRTGAAMHNAYPTLYHRVTRRILDEYEHDHPGRHLWVYTRAGYSGSPGSAAFEQANFPGDETTDWTRASGLPSITTDMLNRAVGGAYGFTSDIGGYLDLFGVPTTPELFARWTQAAALTPFLRIHNSAFAPTGTRQPWSFGPATLRIWKRYAALHLRARPLITRLWREARRTGVPPTRPLWLQFPGDRRGADEDQEWMLGPDLLVAPVVAKGARSRSVYLPRGCWRREGLGRRLYGPRRVRASAPLDALPWYARCGTAPLGRPRS